MKYSDNHTVYYNDKNIEVPSATTILKILNKPALCNWANGLGFQRLRYKDVLEDAASFGTLIHDIISYYLNGYMYIYINDGTFDIHKVYGSLNSFMSWYKRNDIETIFSEKQFSSDTFGGTVDFYGKVNDKYTIIDFKTSKKIRLTMFIQLALYTILLEKHGYVVEQVGIVLCNWKNADSKIISRKDLDKYIELSKVLIDLFHKYYTINESDWHDDII